MNHPSQNQENSNNFLSNLLKNIGQLGVLFAYIYYFNSIYHYNVWLGHVCSIVAIGTILFVIFSHLKSKFINSKFALLITKNYRDKIEKLENELKSMKEQPVNVSKTLDSKIRIVILLPLRDMDKIVEQDVELILEGFGNAFPKVRVKMDMFELIFLDHKNNYEVAKKLIENELTNGCQYFICTMSGVCEPLSKIFSDLLNDKQKKAILLCTASASPEIKTISNQIYRFFVNADEEARFLVDSLKNDGKTASMIHFDTAYSRTTSKKFKENWDNISINHKCEEGIEIQLKDYGNISNELNLAHNKRKLEDKDIIFIVAYCTAYQDIFITLKDLGINSTIVTTSTFSFKKFDDAKKTLLKNFKWVTCYPSKIGGKFYGDAANYFAFASLYRLITVIFHDNYSIENFDEIWCKIKEPTKLNFTPSVDSKIELILETSQMRKNTV